MRASWRITRIMGIDINIDPSWLIIFALVSWTLASYYFPRQFPDWSAGLSWLVGIATSLLFFASVLAHELAHSIVAKWQGEEVRSITLFLLGGVAQITEEPDKPSKEFFMAVVGPLSSIAIGIVFFIIWLLVRGVSQPLGALTQYLAIINVVLAVFNLIPGFPMDGGRVLRALLWKTTGNLRKATRIASTTGQVIAFLFIIGGIVQIFSGLIFSGIWIIFIGWFLHNAATVGYRQVVMKEMLKEVRAKDLMSTDFETIPSNLTIQQLIDEYILKRRDRAFLVSDRGELKGIICLENVKAVPLEKRATTLVAEMMTPKEKLEVVSPEDDGQKVLTRLTVKDVGQLPVMENDEVKGILCRSDVLHHLQVRQELGV